ncbi:hypothetical protein KKH14_01015 [Patescibacteria group bacterium]|nr:hypothetical protein [Patescibacteria group bacterium]
MKIIISQLDKKISITFKDKKLEKSFIVDKSDEFLNCVDKLKLPAENWKNTRLKFDGAGLLTERIIRVIILGLSF